MKCDKDAWGNSLFPDLDLPFEPGIGVPEHKRSAAYASSKRQLAKYNPAEVCWDALEWISGCHGEWTNWACECTFCLMFDEREKEARDLDPWKGWQK